jgi:hypothetical protein
MFTTGYLFITHKQMERDEVRIKREERAEALAQAQEEREKEREQRELRQLIRESEKEKREIERAECKRETQQLERNRQIRERMRELRELRAERRQLAKESGHEGDETEDVSAAMKEQYSIIRKDVESDMKHDFAFKQQLREERNKKRNVSPEEHRFDVAQSKAVDSVKEKKEEVKRGKEGDQQPSKLNKMND